MSTAPATQHPYESLFIVPPETAQDKIDVFVEKLKSTIAQGNGTLRGVQVWGRRRMAYPIKRHKDGLYIYVDFDLDHEAVKAVKSLFSVSDIVIRHLTVVREEAPPPRERKPKPGTEAPAAAAPSEAASPQPSAEAPSN